MAVRVFLPRAGTACAGKHALPAAISREDRRRTPVRRGDRPPSVRVCASSPHLDRAVAGSTSRLASRPAPGTPGPLSMPASRRRTACRPDGLTSSRPIGYAPSAAGHAGGRPMDLALFDFDGTITTRGTYPGFIRFALRPRRKIVAGILLGPLVVRYRAGLVSDRAIRKAMSRIVFQGEQSSTCAVSANGTPPRRCPD